MELTPPLVQSSDCTSKTYCRSESSVTDCPSPELVDQHYSIPSVYNSDLTCSMTSSYEPDVSLSRFDQGVQPEWKWDPAAVVHPSLTRGSVSDNMNAEYDPFSSYDGTFPGLCPSEIHPGRSQYPSSAALPASRSPPPRSASKTTMTHPPIGAGSGSETHRHQHGTANSGYSHDVAGSQYPSPNIAHAPYPPTISKHPSLQPPTRHVAAPNNGLYFLDGSVTSWYKTNRYETELEQSHPDAGSHSPNLQRLTHEAQNASQVGSRPRRAPRKLTTKEDANFECDVDGCGKLFSRSYNFKAHVETHREKREYPFPCHVQDCTKKFVRKTDLRRHHQSVHMKERNYKCEYCGRGFSRKDTLGR